MGNTNKYLTNNIEIKRNLDSSFGSTMLLTGGTMSGNLTADASFLIQGDVSIFHLTISKEGAIGSASFDD